MSRGAGGGLFAREGELAMLPSGKLKLFADFFRRIVKRIESINPVSDPDDTIIVEDNRPGTRGRVIRFNGELIEIDVCKNGAPDKLKVWAEKTELGANG